jgi:hypothetical protein
MTADMDDPDRIRSRFANATAAYIARLKDIADITTLTPGIYDFDYAVTVSAAEKPQLLPLLADLTFDIESEYGVAITTLAVTGSSE